MVTGDAVEEAVQLARETPTLAVGLHLVLAQGRPAAPPAEIPDLVAADGAFRPGPVTTGVRYAFEYLFRAGRAQLRGEIASPRGRDYDRRPGLRNASDRARRRALPACARRRAAARRERGVLPPGGGRGARDGAVPAGVRPRGRAGGAHQRASAGGGARGGRGAGQLCAARAMSAGGAWPASRTSVRPWCSARSHGRELAAPERPGAR